VRSVYPLLLSRFLFIVAMYFLWEIQYVYLQSNPEIQDDFFAYI
jgi:hypothetical protein